MTQETVRRENHALRTITAVMMMFIVVAHYYSQYEIPGTGMKILGWHLMSLGRFVIPVFVLISGYYCFSKDGHAEASLKSKAAHILILIVIYKLVYVIFSTILWITGVLSPDHFVMDDNTWLHLTGITGLDYILTEFLTVSPNYYFDCYGGSVHIMTTQPIWFIYALFLVYGLWYVLYSKKIDFKWSLLLAVPVFLIAIVMVDILPLFGINEVFGIEVDGGFGGILYPFTILPFFVMGYYIHKYKEQIDAKLSNTTIWALIITGIVITALEVYFRPNHYNSSIYLGLLIFIIPVFIGSFRVPEDRGRCKVTEYIGKYLTMWMYVFFGIGNFVIRYAFQAFSDNLFVCEILGPFVALLLTILMAYGFHLFMTSRAAKKKAARAQPE
ncbi:MAG: acyltransferase [Candidatus Methanomethylophilaceae archaeon]|nr:acyltransferase [Candidatus Methanomethylophilaceae archaeon]